MAEWIPNDMKVFGKEKDLGIFKNDIYEGKENILTFRNIIPTREEYSVWEKEKIYPEELNWEHLGWSREWDANQYLINENSKNHLFFIFETRWEPPIPIFITLIKRYQSLNFEIISDFYGDVILEMESVQGKLKKFSEYFSETIELPDRKFNQIWFEQNYIKNKILVLEKPR